MSGSIVPLRFRSLCIAHSRKAFRNGRHSTAFLQKVCCAQALRVLLAGSTAGLHGLDALLVLGASAPSPSEPRAELGQTAPACARLAELTATCTTLAGGGS